jgi:hypothetical protein
MPIRALIVAGVLLLSSPCWAQVPLASRLPACAVIRGNEASLCGCTGPLGPLNLTGFNGTSYPGFVVDGCYTVVNAAGGIGVDVTGSYFWHLKNFQIQNAKIGILAGLDSLHCSTREEGNGIIEGTRIGGNIVPGGYGVVSEGSEQIDFRDNAWIEGQLGALLLVGNTNAPIPFPSPNIASCPTGQTQTVATFYQTTFVGRAPNPAIVVMGDVSEVVAAGLYTTLDGTPRAGPTAISFQGPYVNTLYASNWDLGPGTWRNEGYAKNSTGQCKNCILQSNLNRNSQIVTPPVIK